MTFKKLDPEVVMNIRRVQSEYAALRIIQGVILEHMAFIVEPLLSKCDPGIDCELLEVLKDYETSGSMYSEARIRVRLQNKEIANE
ncbi:MAG: hypothetical protein A2W25_11610 [candidate division Zixibacteria bacterium RBG_16_53_22]|nr:MAG: hypothetical protein A2W25_11610 [candidate division Zixibacteria bacterium RBG_16_53_22]